MELIGAILVFLAGVSAGALVLLCLKIVPFLNGVQARHAQLLEDAESRHREQLAHADATTAIAVERMRVAAGALAAEVREAAAAHRNDLRLAIHLPAVHVPGTPPPPPEASPSVPVPHEVNPSPASTAGPIARRALPLSPANDAAETWTLHDTEVTPPSGWTLEQVRAHTAQHDSRGD